MTDSETAKLFSILMAAYPRHHVTPDTIELYSRCLSDMPFDVLKHASIAHIQNSKWFPTVAELRETALSFISARKEKSIDEQEDERIRRRVVEKAYERERKYLAN